MAMSKRFVGIDFFCGCGGMTAGLLKAGVDVRLGVDIDPICKDTYEKNNGVPFECADVRSNLRARIVRALAKKRGRPVIFAACAPCQPFSKVRKSGVKKHPDTNLLNVFLGYVLAFKPEYVLCENVPQLESSTKGKRIIKKFLKSLFACGYKADVGVVNAADFNVPQNRWRLVIMASRVGNVVKVPNGPTAGAPPVVRQAIGNYPPLRAGERRDDVPNHWAAKLEPKNLERIRAVPRDGGDLRSVSVRLRPPSRKDFGNYGHGGFFDVYGRMKWDAPAPTLTTRCNSYSNGRYGHPEQDRAISIREAAALQSFPDDYVFHVGAVNDAAKLVGNAVPVNLAFHLARVLLNGKK
jgi:DNA (cytosine-5)-methyltransferase 1